MATRSFNAQAAELLLECANLLRQQKANPFRVSAYRRAAETLEALDLDVREILRDEGASGLVKLPAIGQGIASAIAEIARTGHLSRLDQLRGSLDPEALFQFVPGVGPTLARLIYDDLHVDTLEALEVAAYDGRLAAIEGIGPRRTKAVQAGLAALLGRASIRRHSRIRVPTVETLLAVDAEYREKARAGRLQRIAPRRFNPEGSAWLPIIHTDHDGWHVTALFSNTARAHELERTHDWVVLYYYDGDHREGQCTVVTETTGPLQGQRVVRGREAECRRLIRS